MPYSTLDAIIVHNFGLAGREKEDELAEKLKSILLEHNLSCQMLTLSTLPEEDSARWIKFTEIARTGRIFVACMTNEFVNSPTHLKALTMSSELRRMILPVLIQDKYHHPLFAPEQWKDPDSPSEVLPEGEEVLLNRCQHILSKQVHVDMRDFGTSVPYFISVVKRLLAEFRPAVGVQAITGPSMLKAAHPEDKVNKEIEEEEEEESPKPAKELASDEKRPHYIDLAVDEANKKIFAADCRNNFIKAFDLSGRLIDKTSFELVGMERLTYHPQLACVFVSHSVQLYGTSNRWISKVSQELDSFTRLNLPSEVLDPGALAVAPQSGQLCIGQTPPRGSHNSLIYICTASQDSGSAIFNKCFKTNLKSVTHLAAGINNLVAASCTAQNQVRLFELTTATCLWYYFWPQQLRLRAPYGLLFENNRLLVCDKENHLIHMIDIETGNMERLIETQNIFHPTAAALCDDQSGDTILVLAHRDHKLAFLPYKQFIQEE